MHRGKIDDVDVTGFKLIVIGHTGAGKTALVQRYVIGDEFDVTSCQPTMGIDVLHKRVRRNNRWYTLCLWDTSGEEKFGAYLSRYLRECHCVLVVFSLIDRNSVSRTMYHLDLVSEMFPKPGDPARPTFVLVGTKLDALQGPDGSLRPATAISRWETLCKTDGDVSSKQTLTALRAACDASFETLTSAKRGFNVCETFDGALNALLEKQTRDRTVAKTIANPIASTWGTTENGSGGSMWSDDDDRCDEDDFDPIVLDEASVDLNALRVIRCRSSATRRPDNSKCC